MTPVSRRYCGRNTSSRNRPKRDTKEHQFCRTRFLPFFRRPLSMITLTLAAIASFATSAPAVAPSSAAYGNATIAHMKGHAPAPRATVSAAKSAPAVCHPDPGKGRACRHEVAQAKAKQAAALAAAPVASPVATPAAMAAAR
jgi:hypothetical protein